MKYVKLSELEYEFMDYVWSRGGSISFQEFKHHFIDVLKKDWPENYISIYLHNIIKKGGLKSSRNGEFC